MAKDIMNEIYNSKINYDKKCFENKVPIETLEQHMYTYLNQKYGLKNLIIEWAASIINSIKLYSNEDSEINLFGKILRNEQEEDSRIVLSKLKDNISELLEYYLKSKNQSKNEKELKKLLMQKKEGYINEDEWKSIVNYIYSKDDAKKIENKIISYINRQKEKNDQMGVYNWTGVGSIETLNKSHSNSALNVCNTICGSYNNNLNAKNRSNRSSLCITKKLSREELFTISKLNEELNIQYKHFLKILCDHHIKTRDKYLKNFIKLFRKYDTDLDGVLNENEFIGLVKEIPYCQNDIDNYIFKFLSIIDPFNNKKITFNECISLFSMETIEEENINQDDNLNNENVNYNNEINNNKNDDINERNNTKKSYKNDNKVNLLDKICLGNILY